MVTPVKWKYNSFPGFRRDSGKFESEIIARGPHNNPDLDTMPEEEQERLIGKEEDKDVDEDKEPSAAVTSTPTGTTLPLLMILVHSFRSPSRVVKKMMTMMMMMGIPVVRCCAGNAVVLLEIFKRASGEPILQHAPNFSALMH
jgi:hypothetical protein